jgi:Secretion system C-terminal sorting domain
MIHRMYRCLIFVGVAFFMMISGSAYAQYVSVQPGDWNNLATWSPTPPVGGPTASNSTSIVLNHAVTIPAATSYSLDQLTINSGGSLIIASTAMATIANGTGTDITINGGGSASVSGIFQLSDLATTTGMTAANTTFVNGSTYRHLYTTTQGSIPLATWQPTSTVEIAGYTTAPSASAAGNWSQPFGNFTWNCATMGGLYSLNGLVTSVAGNYVVQTTNGGTLLLSSTQTTPVSIGGNLRILGNSRVQLTGASAGIVYTIGGNFEFNATNTGGSNTNTTGNCTLDIAGDFLMNAPAGNLKLSSSGSTGIGTLNITGDVDITAGTLTESSTDPAFGAINFVGIAGTQHTFTNSGTITESIRYNVAANNTLIVTGESSIAATSGSSFTLNGALEVKSVHANGAIQIGTGAGAGNIRTATRTYNAGSRVVYSGAAAQVIGDGHPTAANVETVINNAAGVSVNNINTSTVVVHDLTLTLGNLTIQNNNLTVNGTTSLLNNNLNLTTTSTFRQVTLNGALTTNTGLVNVSSGTENAYLLLNGSYNAGNYITFTGANSILEVDGVSAFSGEVPLSGATTLKLLTISRSGQVISFADNITAIDVDVIAGTLDMNASLTITDDLNIATGAALDFSGQTLALQNQFNNNLTGGLLSGNSTSTLDLTGNAALGTLAFSSGGNTVGTLILNRPQVGTMATLNSTLNIATSFQLIDGIFSNTSGLSMNSGATITRNGNASLSGAIPAGGPYNIRYINGTLPVITSLSTGVETRGSVQNVTIDLTGTCTKATALTVNGALNLNAGTFSNAAAQLLTMANGAVINRTSVATFTGSIPSGGPYDVVYTGTTMTTQPEVRGSLRDFTSNATGIVTVSLPMTVQRAVFLNSGTLAIQSNTLTMANLADFTRHSSGSVTGSVPLGGPYDLFYIGSDLSTQLESQGSLNDVTSNSTGTITLANTLVGVGTLSINSGIWTSGANIVQMGGVTIASLATFNAPSTTLTLTADFTDNGTFVDNNGRVVFNGVSTLPGTSVTTFNDIQLNAAQTLTFPALVNVLGDIDFLSGNAVFNHGSGTVNLNGTSAQQIDAEGEHFYAISVNKVGGAVTLTTSLPLANRLSINSATTFNSDGFLTILSQPDGSGDDTSDDGSIGPIASGGQVSGSVTVQRFLRAKGDGSSNRYISAAVSGVPSTQLTDDFTVTSGTMRFYNEPTRGNFNLGYVNVSSIHYPLQIGRGYLANLANADILWDVSGTINANSIPLPVSYTSAPNPLPAADGWNLVGNPYPSPIVWDNTGGAWNRTNIDPIITVYDVDGTATYTYNYTNGAGTLPNGIIATGQAFWVHLSAAGSLTINETAKATSVNGTFFRKGSEHKLSQLIASISTNQFTDNAVLVLDDDASADFDPLYDGYKLKNESVNIYFQDAEGRDLSMYATNDLEQSDVIPIVVEVQHAGNYTLKLKELDETGSFNDLYFIDKIENKAIPLSEGITYSLVVNREQTTIANRFYLSKRDKLNRNESRIESLQVYPNPSKNVVYIEMQTNEGVYFQLLDASGKILRSGNLSATEKSIDMSGLNDGLYMLKINSNIGMVTRRIVKNSQD